MARAHAAVHAEEAWLARYPSQRGLGASRIVPELPSAWRDDALAEKWRRVRTSAAWSPARSKSNGRTSDRLLARGRARRLRVRPDLFAALVDVDLTESHPSRDAVQGERRRFRLDDVKGVAVEVRLAEGKKCALVEILPSRSDPAIPTSPARRPSVARVGGDAQSGE